LINPELRVVAAADRDITRGRQEVRREAVKKERINKHSFEQKGE